MSHNLSLSFFSFSFARPLPLLRKPMAYPSSTHFHLSLRWSMVRSLWHSSSLVCTYSIHMVRSFWHSSSLVRTYSIYIFALMSHLSTVLFLMHCDDSPSLWVCPLGFYVTPCYAFSLTPFLYFLPIGLVETDPEGALAGFAEVVQMEPEKAEWWVA